jgi:hypothetical protein
MVNWLMIYNILNLVALFQMPCLEIDLEYQQMHRGDKGCDEEIYFNQTNYRKSFYYHGKN